MNFVVEVLTKIMQGSGFAALDWRTVVMLLIACVLLYMGIVKGPHCLWYVAGQPARHRPV